MGELFEIDKDHKITYENATANTLIMGSSGRGKTVNFITPMVDTLIKDGHAGVIVDVKNNFTRDVYRIAKKYGREQDIIEIGNKETADDVNLLHGLTFEELEKVMEMILFRERVKASTSSNGDYYDQNGIRITKDVIRVLYYLSQKDTKYMFCFTLLNAVLHDETFAKLIFEDFKNYITEEPNKEIREEHALFIESIESSSNAFHIFHNNDGERYNEQLTWAMGHVKPSISSLCEKQLAKKFSCTDNTDFSLDFKRLLYAEKKIIVLCFDHFTVEAGTLIANLIKGKIFADILNSDPEKIEDGFHTFMVVDEYQDVCNTDTKTKLNDIAFMTKSREYGHINVFAIQSLSSLYKLADSKFSINELITNCTTKICLQTDDPVTTSYFEKHVLLEDDVVIGFNGINRHCELKTIVSLREEINWFQYDNETMRQVNQTIHIKELRERCWILKTALSEILVDDVTRNKVHVYPNFVSTRQVLDIKAGDRKKKDEEEKRDIFAKKVINYFCKMNWAVIPMNTYDDIDFVAFDLSKHVICLVKCIPYNDDKISKSNIERYSKKVQKFLSANYYPAENATPVIIFERDDVLVDVNLKFNCLDDVFIYSLSNLMKECITFRKSPDKYPYLSRKWLRCQ